MKVQRSLCIALCLWLGAMISFAQPNPTAAKTGTATISGRITLGEKPAVGVTVGVIKMEIASSDDMIPLVRATTDAEGRYRLTNVIGGRLRILAMAPGYITDEQKTDIFSNGRVLNLNEGETVENIDFKLTKGGVITGKVTDAEGRPLIAARLQLYTAPANGRKQPYPFTNNFMMMQTDDRGEYRIYGLLEGRYVIGASAGMTVNNQPAAYHPNTTSQDEAAIVSVTPGAEVRDVDIRFSREGRKTYGVTARVIDVDTGQPVSGVSLLYRSAKPGQSNFSTSMSLGASDSRGIVRLEGLMPGTYSAEISSFARMEGANTDYYSESTPFEITDSDIESIEIRAQRGLTVSGVAVIEGVNDPALTANLFSQIGADGLSASSRSATPGRVMYPHNFKINRDGTFRVSGLAPGTLFFNTNQRTARGFLIVRTEAPNQNERGEVVLTAGQPLSGLRLVLAYGTATVRGQAQIINGALPPNSRLNVSVRRADAPRNSSGRFAEVDARGTFVLDNLPAGEYEITLNSFSPMTMVTVERDGSTTTTGNSAPPPRPMMVRQKIIVPATGEVAVTMTLDVAAQQQPPQRNRE